MTDQHAADMNLINKGAAAARQLLAQIEEAQREQPAKLADMRRRAAIESDRCRVEEPWLDHVSAIPSYTTDGEVTDEFIDLDNLDEHGRPKPQARQNAISIRAARRRIYGTHRQHLAPIITSRCGAPTRYGRLCQQAVNNDGERCSRHQDDHL
ncbi:hypothetical protein ACIGKQ_16570 [Gordonia sp. NPDC062954]|uniref:hypothetical protein n=1 Tax=unclassified Gordonia (in: high G+C Gram-positive bacteria) TaxID=2657482 RepID=UPI000C39F05E|nr:hypothetical protein [Gordonia sp. (in: high G+C Gram-positive bacteria)]MAU83408.1 hypothetical protein [Gordonia sp. (in: high G+C Gram-positive bacteria)]